MSRTGVDVPGAYERFTFPGTHLMISWRARKRNTALVIRTAYGTDFAVGKFHGLILHALPVLLDNE